jgi:hypothetical protein
LPLSAFAAGLPISSTAAQTLATFMIGLHRSSPAEEHNSAN